MPFIFEQFSFFTLFKNEQKTRANGNGLPKTCKYDNLRLKINKNEQKWTKMNKNEQKMNKNEQKMVMDYLKRQLKNEQKTRADGDT